jgi:hypothetical protein
MSFSKWIADFIKEALNQTIVQLLLVYLGTTTVLGTGFSLLSKWIKGTSLFLALKQEYLFPAWIILLVSSAFLTILLILFFKHYHEQFLWRQKKNYISQDLDWTLTKNFFMNYEDVLLDQTSPSFIRSCIIGPFCPICKVDVTSMAAGGSFVCLNGHDLKTSKAYRILSEQGLNRWSIDDFWNIIRSRVYAEVQGAARSGKL